MNVNIIIDPTKSFSNISNDYILESLGLLPSFAANEQFKDIPLKEALHAAYGFGLFEMHGGIVSEEGIYKYPEDPELIPLAKIERDDEYFYQYKYGIVAIKSRDSDKYFVTRLD